MRTESILDPLTYPQVLAAPEEQDPVDLIHCGKYNPKSFPTGFLAVNQHKSLGIQS